MPSFFEKLAKSTLKALIKEGINKVFQKSKNRKEEARKSTPVSNESATDSLKNHPWRLCPMGEHWVKTHPLTVPASGKGPTRKTVRQGHCQLNPKRKSEFYTSDELKEIAEIHFKTLMSDPEAMPIPDSLSFPNGNKYDLLIAGWTKFWNEILKPEDPPTPDFIKALIATESSFNLVKDQKSSDGLARGLIQVTDSTRKILQNLKGELRNHHIELNVEESRDPVTNIAAGIRWLHHKKFLAEDRLKRKVTWEEASAEYKGILNDIGKDAKTDDIMKKLKRHHQRLKDLRKKR
jgi:hypothetical protein